MPLIKRALEEKLSRLLRSGKSILLLGPRQTGKTTLISQYKADLDVTLLIAKTRRQYEADPDQLIREVKAIDKPLPLIVIDEVQKVPALMDSVQYLIDKKLGQFILTGSSARKLRDHKNLLPGRVIQLHLDPLTTAEMESDLPSIEELLVYGSLPGIRAERDLALREEILESYVDLYLEDEVRAEALVRDIGTFENFLRLAAIESGNGVNFDKISQDVGVARTTIASYYQVLEDCLIAERVEAYTKSTTRKRLMKSPRYLLFDMGLRRMAAREHTELPQKYLGALFEQWVGLELIRWTRLQQGKARVYFWRDSGGPEVDWLIEKNNRLIPIEVKWSEKPSPRDAKHLELFLREYPESVSGLVVCQTERRQALSDKVMAISWKELFSQLNSLFS